MAKSRARPIPTEVLERAKLAAHVREPARPPSPPAAQGKPGPARDKVIAALKRLHPMD